MRKRSRGALLSPAALAVFLHSQAAHAMEQYFCVADQATGFVWRESRWRRPRSRSMMTSSSFKRSCRARTSDKKLGDASERHTCSQFRLENFRAEQISCGGLGFGFVLHTKTLRYQEFYGIGYVEGGDTLRNTPSLTIGKCTRMN